MSSNFPANLDSLQNPLPETKTRSLNPALRHARQHQDVNDAVEALEAKVGVDGSAVTSSLDYKVTNLQAQIDAVVLAVVNLSATVVTEQGKVTTLQGQMTTANNNIATNTNNIAVASSDIDALEADVYSDALSGVQAGGIWPTIPRNLMNANFVIPTGELRIAYFTASKSGTTNNVRIPCLTGYTGGTPTLIRIGLYTSNAAGDGLSLVASTVSDTTLFAANNTDYTKAWSASYAMVKGQRYALVVLVVTAGTGPTLYTNAIQSISEARQQPILAARLGSQANLPASWTAAQIAALTTTSRPYAVLQ